MAQGEVPFDHGQGHEIVLRALSWRLKLAARPPSAAPIGPAVISIRDLKTHCSNCSMRELCLPIGLGQDAMRQLDELITERTRLKRGDVLYRAGDTFRALYAIRTGSCKTTVLARTAASRSRLPHSRRRDRHGRHRRRLLRFAGPSRWKIARYACFRSITLKRSRAGLRRCSTTYTSFCRGRSRATKLPSRCWRVFIVPRDAWCRSGHQAAVRRG
jgi:hypothetical protein